MGTITVPFASPILGLVPKKITSATAGGGGRQRERLADRVDYQCRLLRRDVGRPGAEGALDLAARPGQDRQ